MPKRGQQITPTNPPAAPGPPSSQQAFSVTRAEYSGPIPPPAMMAQFNEVVPNGADRILRMAEKQQEHRHFLEQTTVLSDSKQSKNGLIAGVFVTTVAYLTSGFLGYTGHDTAAIAITGTVTAGMVSAFVYGTHSRKQERMQKNEELTKKRPTA